MTYSKKIGPLLVSASVATIVVANFFIVWQLAQGGHFTLHLLGSIWPVVLTSTVAIILVMSFLHQALLEILVELESREKLALEFGMRDPLTGLANRALFEERLTAAIERQRRQKENFAVLMLDLDHFKKVNDLHGHHFGDELLKAVSSRLRELSREIDTVARIGGDEFVIIQANVRGGGDVRPLCQRIIAALTSPFQIEGRQVNVGTSIGFVLSSQTASTPDEYLRRADIALYRAKDMGRNQYQHFSSALDAEVHRRAHIEDCLRRALNEGTGLDVHYQPQIDAFGNTRGVEALLRWEHPEYGDISPSEVIEIAEEVNLIEQLGEFVFAEACATAVAFPDFFVAVNVSPVQFLRSTRLASTFKQIAENSGVSCDRIELEITENVLIDQDANCTRQMTSLRSAGFRIALDDFGTGYSSLSYLRNFQVDKIKLDRSFASDEGIEKNIAVLQGVVTLAHTLGLEVVAEGIETIEQEHAALEAGCDGLQGYRYGVPVSAGQLGQLTRSRKAAA